MLYLPASTYYEINSYQSYAGLRAPVKGAYKPVGQSKTRHIMAELANKA